MFKQTKTNLPKASPPKSLQNFLDSVHDDILHSPLNKVSPNLSKEEQTAIDLLVTAQRRREVTLKPNDKAGGCSLLDVPDYQAACLSHLQSTFTDTNGQGLHLSLLSTIE